jgi:hypothetical protein
MGLISGKASCQGVCNHVRFAALCRFDLWLSSWCSRRLHVAGSHFSFPARAVSGGTDKGVRPRGRPPIRAPDSPSATTFFCANIGCCGGHLRRKKLWRIAAVKCCTNRFSCWRCFRLRMASSYFKSALGPLSDRARTTTCKNRWGEHNARSDVRSPRSEGCAIVRRCGRGLCVGRHRLGQTTFAVSAVAINTASDAATSAHWHFSR